MKPGDVISCADCGASSLPLHATGGRWPDQGSSALIITWAHGPHVRHDTGNAEGWRGRCLWCADRLGDAPTSIAVDRREPFAARDESEDAPDGAVLFLDGGRGWHTRAGSHWYPISRAEARRRGADVEREEAASSAGAGPLNARDESSGPVKGEAGAPDGNKAPLERSTWCLDEPGPVPSWLKGYGGTSRAYLEKRYGAGAHFQRNGGVSDDTAIGAALPLASRDALRTLELPERFLDLARTYRDETGRWPYGYELALVPPGDVIDATNAPWITWCRARNAAAAPKRPPAQPKGQMGLGL